MQTILLVEDDSTLRMGMGDALEREGFLVLTAENIVGARNYLPMMPSLVLLDLNLPDGNGFSLCEEIKRKFNIPIIFLTVRDDERDITKGLDMGGDDYIIKPFRLPVLLSRIRAVLRRYSQHPPDHDALTCGEILLLQSQTKVTANGAEVALTASEYRLLLTLLQNKNQTLTRNKLLELLWDNDSHFVEDNTLTVTMKRLREKLGESSDRIKTVRGIGYKAVDTNDQ
ncbi:MAG: response regulator transcription factor [Lachnospiraceae bacterium]|nr:response regulator transcription factor [Lachnospiraceae bacterium]